MNKKLYIMLFLGLGVLSVFVYNHLKTNDNLAKKNFIEQTNQPTDSESELIAQRKVKKNPNIKIEEKIETEKEKNRRLVIEKNERLQLRDLGAGEVLLSKVEREFARKVVNDGVIENTLMLTPFDNMTISEFDALVDNISNEDSSQKSIENQSKYLGILNSAIGLGAPISLDRIECGEAICLASITYDHEDDNKGFGFLYTFLKKSGYDGNASAVIGENDYGFTSQNKRGLVFTNGDGEGILFNKHKWAK